MKEEESHCPWSRLDWWWPVSSKWQGGRYKDWAGQVALPLQACVLALRVKPLSRHQRREWHKPRCQILRRCQTVTLSDTGDTGWHKWSSQTFDEADSWNGKISKIWGLHLHAPCHPVRYDAEFKRGIRQYFIDFLLNSYKQMLSMVFFKLTRLFHNFFQNQATFPSFSSCLLFEVWTQAGSVILAAVNGSSTTKVGKDRFFLV